MVYAKTIERAEDDAVTGDETVTRIPMLRAYTVFNTDQIDGLPAPTSAQPSAIEESVSTRIERADAFIAATGATIVHRGNRACYIPSADRIEMPPYAQFIDTPTASAAAHASTGAKRATGSRVKRERSRRSDRFIGRCNRGQQS